MDKKLIFTNSFINTLVISL